MISFNRMIHLGLNKKNEAEIASIMDMVFIKRHSCGKNGATKGLLNMKITRDQEE